MFDADNTTYRYDLESLLPYLENRGVLTRDTLDPSLKLIPFKDSADYRESLTSYYYRLCEIDARSATRGSRRRSPGCRWPT